ncbi:MAG: DUF4974 domain-containing protein [Armatimonadota bacterium]
MRRHSGLLVLLNLCLLGWAQTPPSKAIDPEVDTRLSKRVSMRMAAEPLRKVVAELQRHTGIRLSVAPEIAEYRACLLVKERPLHEVMQKLQQAFGFHWKVEGDSPESYRYQFYQPAAERAAERRLFEQIRWGNVERLRRYIEKHRQAFKAGKLTDLVRKEREAHQRLRTMPPPTTPPTEDQLRTQQESNPFSVSPIGVEQVTLAYMLLQLGEQGFKRLKEGLPIVGSSKDPQTRRLIPPDLPQAMALQERERLKAIQELNPDSPYLAEIHQSSRQRIERMEQAAEVSVWFQLDPETLSGEFQITLRDKQGQVITTSTDTIGFHFSGLYDEQAILYTVRSDNPMPPLPDHPAFTKELAPFKPEQGRWWHWQALRLLRAAEESEVLLVAEFYPLSHIFPIEAAPFFNTWADLLRWWYLQLYDWRYDSGWLIFSHAQRALARGTDVPEALLEAWIRQPSYDLETYARMAQLTGEQISALHSWVMTCELYVPDTRMYPYLRTLSYYLQNLRDQMPLREAMRFYATLPTNLKQQLQPGRTVSLKNLSRQSLEHLQRVVLSARRTGQSGEYEGVIDESDVSIPTRLRIQRKASPYQDPISFVPGWVTGGVETSEWLQAQPEEVRNRYTLYQQTEWVTLIFEGDAVKPMRFSFPVYRYVDREKEKPRGKVSPDE